MDALQPLRYSALQTDRRRSVQPPNAVCGARGRIAPVIGDVSVGCGECRRGRGDRSARGCAHDVRILLIAASRNATPSCCAVARLWPKPLRGAVRTYRASTSQIGSDVPRLQAIRVDRRPPSFLSARPVTPEVAGSSPSLPLLSQRGGRGPRPRSPTGLAAGVWSPRVARGGHCWHRRTRRAGCGGHRAGASRLRPDPAGGKGRTLRISVSSAGASVTEYAVQGGPTRRERRAPALWRPQAVPAPARRAQVHADRPGQRARAGRTRARDGAQVAARGRSRDRRGIAFRASHSREAAAEDRRLHPHQLDGTLARPRRETRPT